MATLAHEASRQETRIDPVLTEIIRNTFVSITNEIGVTMERAAMSPVLREGKDCCCVMSDMDGNLVAVSDFSQPAFNGTLQYTVQAVIKAIGKENMRPGDMYMVNDPYTAGTHTMDNRVVKPVFAGDEIMAFFTVVGHWTDMGGMGPGTFYVYATEAYQEGLRIPPILLVRDGEVDESVVNLICANIRMPHVSRGDLLAMVASLNTGEIRFQELVSKYGAETIKTVMREYEEYATRLMQDIISKLPEGRYEWMDYIDKDPCAETDALVPIKLTVIIEGGQMTYDFTGSAPQAKGPINFAPPCTFSAAMMGTKMMFPEVPYNYGTMKPIKIIVPEDCVMNAKFPAPVTGAAIAFQKIESLFLGCFSQIAPERVMACCGNICNITWGGWDRRVDPPEYVVVYCWQECGWGGRAAKDGFQGCQVYLAGGALNIPMEVYEHQSPVVIREYAFIRDTGGAGKNRGGCATKRLIEFEFDGVVSALGDREKTHPFGLFGGEHSVYNSLVLNDGRPDERNIGMYCINEPFKLGDTLRYVTAGGGGYGLPLERAPEKVLADVIEGYVSVEKARDTYGVVLKEVPETSLSVTYIIDQEATRTFRKNLMLG